MDEIGEEKGQKGDGGKGDAQTEHPRGNGKDAQTDDHDDDRTHGITSHAKK